MTAALFSAGVDAARRVLTMTWDLPLKAGEESSCLQSQGKAHSPGLTMSPASPLFLQLTEDS